MKKTEENKKMKKKEGGGPKLPVKGWKTFWDNCHGWGVFAAKNIPKHLLKSTIQDFFKATPSVGKDHKGESCT